MSIRSTMSAAGLLVALGFVGTAACDHGLQLRPEEPSTSAMPDDVRASYQLFAQRCSKCHSLARVFDSGITDDGFWVRYVERMRRQPGSGITKADGEIILQYLRYYSAEKRAAAKSEADHDASLPVSVTGADAAVVDAVVDAGGATDGSDGGR